MTKGKATKEKLYKRLAKEFEQKVGGLENQPLYKALTLEDLQEIAGIIDKRLWLGDDSGDNQKRLKDNLVNLWKEKNKFLALDKKIKISNGAKICFSAAGFEKYGFEVVKDDKVLCKFSIVAKRGYDSGFTYSIQMNDEEVEQGVLNDEETAFDFKTVAADEKGIKGDVDMFCVSPKEFEEEAKKGNILDEGNGSYAISDGYFWLGWGAYWEEIQKALHG